MTDLKKRNFLKLAIAGGAAIGFAGCNGAGSPGNAPSASPRVEDEPTPNPLSTEPGVERRRFGNTDLQVSVLGFGGAQIGYRETEQTVVDRLLNSALDVGLNVIDTAASYWGSEEAIGKAVAHRRREYHLFTKAGHTVGGKIVWHEGWSGAEISRSIDRSLKRLRTDWLDVVHLHSCGLDILKRGEAVESLQKAQRAGKVRYIGYSGDNEAALWAVQSGLFDTLMTSVNIVDQRSIDTTLPLARERGMGVVAKRPIANAVWRYDMIKEGMSDAVYWHRLQKLDFEFSRGPAGKADGPGSPGDIALRFTLSVPGVHTAIVGTSNPDRYRQNAELLKAGPVPHATFEAIRARWKAVATESWRGIE